jgi:hypothetical protein
MRKMIMINNKKYLMVLNNSNEIITKQVIFFVLDRRPRITNTPDWFYKEENEGLYLLYFFSRRSAAAQN